MFRDSVFASAMAHAGQNHETAVDSLINAADHHAGYQRQMHPDSHKVGRGTIRAEKAKPGGYVDEPDEAGRWLRENDTEKPKRGRPRKVA